MRPGRGMEAQGRSSAPTPMEPLERLHFGLLRHGQKPLETHCGCAASLGLASLFVLWFNLRAYFSSPRR